MEQISQILKEIQRAGRLYREQKLAPHGLTPQHGIYLKEIGDAPGISQEQLTQRIFINKSNVARRVAAMEEEGFIERRTCGKDKRVMRLYLTEKGQALLPAIEQITQDWEQILVQELTESEQQILEILLLRLRSNALGSMEVDDK